MCGVWDLEGNLKYIIAGVPTITCDGDWAEEDMGSGRGWNTPVHEMI